ncbi:MAG: hypothetical protein NVS3B14_03460 [Ktedonobacteraceae bacterium]
MGKICNNILTHPIPKNKSNPQVFPAFPQNIEETPYAGIQKRLDTFVHDALDLPGVQIETRWAGIMAFTPDSLLLVELLPSIPRCYICGGYTGHDNAFAIHAARLVSELVMGKENADVGLFEPRRFL